MCEAEEEEEKGWERRHVLSGGVWVGCHRTWRACASFWLEDPQDRRERMKKPASVSGEPDERMKEKTPRSVQFIRCAPRRMCAWGFWFGGGFLHGPTAQDAVVEWVV